MGRGLAFQVELHNDQVCKALRERLMTMSSGKFEELICSCWRYRSSGHEKCPNNSHEVKELRGDAARIKRAVQVNEWKPRTTSLSRECSRCAAAWEYMNEA